MKLVTLKSQVQMLASPAKMATVNPSSWRGETQSAAQRGYGHAWRKARAGYLAKHPFCVFCLRDAGIVATDIPSILSECDAKHVRLPYASVVDHSTPHRGDMKIFWDSSRWQSLCAHHHNSEAQRRDNAGGSHLSGIA